jgi:hypothetical protein
MAEQKGNRAYARPKSRKLNYFYLNGLLHKSLHINRGADKITTWCYPLTKRVTYTYSAVKKQKEPAYTTKEVGQMLGRDRQVLEWAIIDGNIEEPQHTYGLNADKRKYKYMWSEKDILEAHAYLGTVHRGRPRKDGLVTSAPLPTVRELRAMIRQEELLYVKTESGEFVPVWRAPDFD